MTHQGSDGRILQPHFQVPNITSFKRKRTQTNASSKPLKHQTHLSLTSKSFTKESKKKNEYSYKKDLQVKRKRNRQINNFFEWANRICRHPSILHYNIEKKSFIEIFIYCEKLKL